MKDKEVEIQSYYYYHSDYTQLQLLIQLAVKKCSSQK